MLKNKPAILLAASLMIGCASTTPRCVPEVIRLRPPENLLIRPQEPLLLMPGLRFQSGMSPGFTPKILPAGQRVGSSSTP